MILLPIGDDTPRYRMPWVTFGIIGVNVLIHIYVMTLDKFEYIGFLGGYASLGSSYNPLRSLSAGFLHGGLFHLLGNMWFLYLFGSTVEGKLGHWRMALCYFLLLVISDLGQYLFSPTAYPFAIGASGAVSGILAMYWFLFPRYTISYFYWFVVFLGRVELRVHWAVVLWFGFDVFYIWREMSTGSPDGIAHVAHAAGFVAGLIAGVILRSFYLVTLDGEDMFSLWMIKRARKRSAGEYFNRPTSGRFGPDNAPPGARPPDIPDRMPPPGRTGDHRPDDDDEPIPFD